MELYTLTSKFLPKKRVNEFTSVIWTERYFTAGDVQLVVAPTSEMIEMFKPGTFLWLRGGMEVMELKTHSIENGLLTVTGESILQYLNQRQAWFKNTAYDGSDPSVSMSAELTSDIMTAGELISSAVDQTVINPPDFTSTIWDPINLVWASDVFPGLILGPIDDNGTPQRFSIPLGPLYDSIQRLAQEQGVGLKLYLRSASYDSGFVFKFATYRGKDRTSDQDVHLMVRLTPKMDALTDVKEIGSISQYKNVFYVHYKNDVSEHYIPGLDIPTGFDRRTLLVDAPDIFLLPENIAAFRAQTARNAIANHIYIQAVDGNVSSKIPYIYGVDYGLGDVIELQGYTEIFSKARVVEYIRSQDQFGEQEYPTLAVLDPLFIGTMPDLEPDEEFPEWYDDTDFDLDFDDDIWDDPEHKGTKKKPNIKQGEGQLEDPNPEPEPVFEPDELSPGLNTSGIIVIGSFPVFGEGMALGLLKMHEELLTLWHYTGDELPVDHYVDIYPQEFTPSREQAVVKSIEIVVGEDDTREGHIWWITDGVTATPLTVLVADDNVGGYVWILSGSGSAVFNHVDNDTQYWYIPRKREDFPEAVYADGLYSPDHGLGGEEHGEAQHISGGSYGPQELFVSYDGTDGATKIMGPEDFHWAMRWSEFQQIQSSPDGSKITFQKYKLGPTDHRTIVGWPGVTGGTFTISVGEFGDLSTIYTTPPIAWDANAEDIFDRLVAIPTMRDPRDTGYTGTPFDSSQDLPDACDMIVEAIPENGCWLVVHSEGLTWDESYNPLTSRYNWVTHFGELRDSRKLFMSDSVYEGEPGEGTQNLEELDVLSSITSEAYWSPDGTKLHGRAKSEDGISFFRWFNYDIATEELTFPIDYTGVIDPREEESGTFGPLEFTPRYSPDGSKIAFMIRLTDLTLKLLVADADGTNIEELYHQPLGTTSSTDPDDISMGPEIIWNIQNTKLAILDTRAASPVWIFRISDGAVERVWDGSEWPTPDRKVIDHLVGPFDG